MIEFFFQFFTTLLFTTVEVMGHVIYIVNEIKVANTVSIIFQNSCKESIEIYINQYKQKQDSECLECQKLFFLYKIIKTTNWIIFS